MKKKKGEIKDFKVWPSVPLWRIKKIWKVDFKVVEIDGTESYHEAKPWSQPGEDFKSKRDAFLICFPQIKLFINWRLWTAPPNLEKMQRYDVQAAVRKNKRAAESRKRMAESRKQFLAKQSTQTKRRFHDTQTAGRS